jgi:ABC-2 type transport system ATP-binding protein
MESSIIVMNVYLNRNDMTNQLKNKIVHLKDAISSGQLIANELYDFASEFAINKDLVNEAVLLQLQFYMVEGELQKEELLPKIYTLIDRIEIDNIENQDSDLARQNQKTIQAALSNFDQFKKEKEPVIVLKDIEKQYKRGGFKLQKTSASFKLGEITGVVGANANGKSTLLKIIVGELLQDKGTIEFPYFEKQKKQSLNWNDIKKRVAYIPQELAPWNGTVRENLHFEAVLHGLKGKKNELEVNFILERLGLTADEDKTWDELSGGFKLRFALAKALVWKPALLVMDEPLANLDIMAQMVVLNDIKALAHSYSYPFCVIVTSQHIHEIENIADKMIVLEDGRVEYNGKVKDYGKDRLGNVFEIKTDETVDSLKLKLKDIAIEKVISQGFYITIYTPLSIGSAELLDACNKQHIKLEYFRNISQSVKQMFYESQKKVRT